MFFLPDFSELESQLLRKPKEKNPQTLKPFWPIDTENIKIQKN